MWNEVERWNPGNGFWRRTRDRRPLSSRSIGWRRDCIPNVNDLQDRRDRAGRRQSNPDPSKQGIRYHRAVWGSRWTAESRFRRDFPVPGQTCPGFALYSLGRPWPKRYVPDIKRGIIDDMLLTTLSHPWLIVARSTVQYLSTCTVLTVRSGHGDMSFLHGNRAPSIIAACASAPESCCTHSGPSCPEQNGIFPHHLFIVRQLQSVRSDCSLHEGCS